MLEHIRHNCSKRQHEWCFSRTSKFVRLCKRYFYVWHFFFQQIAIIISHHFRIPFSVKELYIFFFFSPDSPPSGSSQSLVFLAFPTSRTYTVTEDETIKCIVLVLKLETSDSKIGHEALSSGWGGDDLVWQWAAVPTIRVSTQVAVFSLGYS